MKTEERLTILHWEGRIIGMLISRTRWDIQEVDEEAAERLADQCGIHPLIARLL